MASKSGRGKGEAKTSTRMVEAKHRQQQALALRRAGATFADIADALGYANPSCAYKAVTTALAELPVADADALRQLEADRLDEMQVQVYRRALNGDPAAIDQVLRIMHRRARLLGLDMPARLESHHREERVQVFTLQMGSRVMPTQANDPEHVAALPSGKEDSRRKVWRDQQGEEHDGEPPN